MNLKQISAGCAALMIAKLGYETVQVTRVLKESCVHSSNRFAVPYFVNEHSYLLRHLFNKLPTSCSAELVGAVVAGVATVALGYGLMSLAMRRAVRTAPRTVVQAPPVVRAAPSLHDFVPAGWAKGGLP